MTMKETRPIVKVEHHSWGYYFETMQKAVAVVSHNRQVLRRELGRHTQIEVRKVEDKYR